MGNEPARGCPDPPHGVTYGWSSVCLGVGDSVVLSLASGSLSDPLAGSAPGVSLSASAGLRMASSGPMATPRTRTAMTMTTRTSHRILLLDGCSPTREGVLRERLDYPARVRRARSHPARR